MTDNYSAEELTATVTALGEIFGPTVEKPLSPDADSFFRIDAANCMAIQALSKRAQQVFRLWLDSEEKQQKPPELNYDENPGRMQVSRDYFRVAQQLLQASGDISLKIWTRKDYPITLETEDWRIIIAPRVDGG